MANEKYYPVYARLLPMTDANAANPHSFARGAIDLSIRNTFRPLPGQEGLGNA